jgi:hypothetical protein
MNFISNIFSYVKETYNYFYAPKNEIEDDDDDDEPFVVDNIETIYYFFINTANIYNASELLLDTLNKYKGEQIKIYLLKSHTLEQLFENTLIVNNYNIEWIQNKLSKQRRHLHTMIDAIDSFIEYNNIRNYHIFY